MFKRRRIALVVLVVAALFAIGAMVETTSAQKAAVPKPQNKLELGEDDVKELLLLMETDKNGRISKQEFMQFMEAEFDRLDKNKNGELDAKELAKSTLRANHPYPFALAGK